MELCMREKAVFFLPVNILTVWSPAFLAARHTTVCLDFALVCKGTRRSDRDTLIEQSITVIVLYFLY